MTGKLRGASARAWTAVARFWTGVYAAAAAAVTFLLRPIVAVYLAVNYAILPAAIIAGMARYGPLSAEYTVHWLSCLGKNEVLWWELLIGALSITGAYIGIPCVLTYIFWRRGWDLPWQVGFLACDFILSCGTGHSITWWVWSTSGLLDVQAGMNLRTGLTSWATVGALWWFRFELIGAATGSQVRQIGDEIGGATTVQEVLTLLRDQRGSRIARRLDDSAVGLVEGGLDGVMQEIDGKPLPDGFGDAVLGAVKRRESWAARVITASGDHCLALYHRRGSRDTGATDGYVGWWLVHDTPMEDLPLYDLREAANG